MSACKLLPTALCECLLCDFVENFQCASAPLLSTSKVFLWELHLKQMIVFPDIIGHLRSSICLTLLSSQHAPSQTVASLIYMGTRRTQLNLKPGPVYSNHVNRSNILLPKLTSFHLAADFTRCLLYERGDFGRRWVSSFDVPILSPPLACLILY